MEGEDGGLEPRPQECPAHCPQQAPPRPTGRPWPPLTPVNTTGSRAQVTSAPRSSHSTGASVSRTVGAPQMPAAPLSMGRRQRDAEGSPGMPGFTHPRGPQRSGHPQGSPRHPKDSPSFPTLQGKQLCASERGPSACWRAERPSRTAHVSSSQSQVLLRNTSRCACLNPGLDPHQRGPARGWQVRAAPLGLNCTRPFPAVPLWQTPRPSTPLIQRPLSQTPWLRLPFGACFAETALGLWLIYIKAQLVRTPSASLFVCPRSLPAATARLLEVRRFS